MIQSEILAAAAIREGDIKSYPFLPPPALESLLDALKVREFNHSHGRTLYDHLCGTWNVLVAWNESDTLATAGLFHSVYSTDAYHSQAVPYERRGALATILGAEAESLVYFFSITTREEVLSVLRSEAPRRDKRYFSLRSRLGGQELIARETLLDLVILQAANLVEQACTSTGAPSTYLYHFAEVSALLRAAGDVRQSLGSIKLDFDLIDEMEVIDFYTEAVAQENSCRTSGLQLFERCSQRFPFLAEPLVWQSWIQGRSGDTESSRNLAERAAVSMTAFGTNWDKRLSAETWLSAATELRLNSQSDIADAALTHILESQTNSRINVGETKRFVHYLAERFTERSSKRVDWYPGLRSAPWHEATAFSITKVLENSFPVIEKEVLAVKAANYHDEAEPIGRSGRWQIFPLFESGKKNEANCAQCPALIDILEHSDEVRISSGLIYLSRLAAGSHIASHRGGSNIRLRCHLGIVVPDGDCYMRVGSVARQWAVGKCMVFDDLYEHEVWNKTDDDRIVLVVDLWHPDITASEKLCLEAVNWMGNRRAAGRQRYLEMNRKQKEKEYRINRANA